MHCVSVLVHYNAAHNFMSTKKSLFQTRIVTLWRCEFFAIVILEMPKL